MDFTMKLCLMLSNRSQYAKVTLTNIKKIPKYTFGT